MIVCLLGPICSGKDLLANYLREKHNFNIINIREALEREKFHLSELPNY
jgi:dephospho-CoA kinase